MNRGFTLIEILLTIGIIAILASVVIIAINPAKQIAAARDLQRTSDLNNINKALVQYQINNKGVFPTNLPVAETEICDTGNKTTVEVSSDDCNGFVDLSFLVPDYLVAIPRDPSVVALNHGLIKSAYAATIGGNGYLLFLKNQRVALVADRAETKKITINTSETYEVRRISVGHGTPSTPTTPAWACGDVLVYQNNNYPTVKIGNKCWLATNLKAVKYLNGDNIPYYGASTVWSEWNNLIGKFTYFNNDQNYQVSYGILYNWYAVSDSRGICPTGWHLSSDADWNNLETTLGTDAGAKLKATVSSSISWDGSNQSGFNAVPSGIHWSDGSFSSWSTAYFWTSDISGDNIISRQLAAWDSSVTHTTNNKAEGLAVRCTQD